jgi:hypothetical protein
LSTCVGYGAKGATYARLRALGGKVRFSRATAKLKADR